MRRWPPCRSSSSTAISSHRLTHRNKHPLFARHRPQQFRLRNLPEVISTSPRPRSPDAHCSPAAARAEVRQAHCARLGRHTAPIAGPLQRSVIVPASPSSAPPDLAGTVCPRRGMAPAAPSGSAPAAQRTAGSCPLAALAPATVPRHAPRHPRPSRRRSAATTPPATPPPPGSSTSAPLCAATDPAGPRTGTNSSSVPASPSPPLTVLRSPPPLTFSCGSGTSRKTHSLYYRNKCQNARRRGVYVRIVTFLRLTSAGPDCVK